MDMEEKHRAQVEFDPTLAENLVDLIELAKTIGAEGVYVLRGVTGAALQYTPAGEINALDDLGPNTTVNLSMTLPLNDAGVLVVMRFPATDGRGLDIEQH
jgi:hypothetical protein